ncbi:MAG: hypothetical protein IKX85_05775 [Clostridia bacterium]|nr:hypothetical protein [Clostridia bacterium]
MKIADNIIKDRLKNVYFLCGGAYGGKTTMAKLLEEKHGFVRYRQGDRADEYFALADPEEQPAMSVDRSADWHAFFAQPPRRYADWMRAELREEAEFAVADLLRFPPEQKVIVDGIIPPDILKRISDHDRVFLLFAPDEMKRKHYFDRADKEEIYRFILSFPDGEELLGNVIEALNLDNAVERRQFIESGFRYRERSDGDTIGETLRAIEEHFGLYKSDEI